MKFKKKKNMLILKRLIAKKENIKGKLYNFKTCKFQIEIFVVFLYIIRSVCVYSVNKHQEKRILKCSLIVPNWCLMNESLKA